MSGSRKCPCCGLHYIGRCVAACWYCLNGYDPRGPFGQDKPSAANKLRIALQVREAMREHRKGKPWRPQGSDRG